MEMIPDRVPDEACTNPAIRQIEGANYPQKVPAQRIGANNGTNIENSHDSKPSIPDRAGECLLRRQLERWTAPSEIGAKNPDLYDKPKNRGTPPKRLTCASLSP